MFCLSSRVSEDNSTKAKDDDRGVDMRKGWVGCNNNTNTAQKQEEREHNHEDKKINDDDTPE